MNNVSKKPNAINCACFNRCTPSPHSTFSIYNDSFVGTCMATRIGPIIIKNHEKGFIIPLNYYIKHRSQLNEWFILIRAKLYSETEHVSNERRFHGI